MAQLRRVRAVEEVGGKFWQYSEITGVCARCKEQIEWKRRYSKYKPLTEPAKCQKCSRRAVRQAYHNLCSVKEPQENRCLSDLGSSFWGMFFILASTNLLTARIAAGFIVFLGVAWLLQEMTKVRVLRYVVLFIGVMNSLFSVYDIYDDLISHRAHTSDAEKFAEVCPCCNGAGWGAIWGLISLLFLFGAMYLGLVILS